MSRILIIEDELPLQRAIAANFRFEDYEVLSADSGLAGYQLATERHPDLIILDLMLPDISGYEVCRKLRTSGITTPVLILTAKSEEADRVAGLDLGADDYVTKPFSVRELSARVRALLRRAKPSSELPSKLHLGALEIDFHSYQAVKNGAPIDFTRKEFQLLQFLYARAGHVLSREDLLAAIWGAETFVTNRTVDTHIANLRAKIEPEPPHPRHIVTVHGVGYRWDD